MVTIKSMYQTADGYDVDVVLSDGTQHTFHFAGGLPADVQQTIDVAAAAYIAIQKPIWEIEAENGVTV